MCASLRPVKNMKAARNVALVGGAGAVVVAAARARAMSRGDFTMRKIYLPEHVPTPKYPPVTRNGLWVDKVHQFVRWQDDAGTEHEWEVTQRAVAYPPERYEWWRKEEARAVVAADEQEDE